METFKQRVVTEAKCFINIEFVNSMKNMKTTFMAILMVLVSFNASAQISRTIMGMTLGVSTPEQCSQIMERKGIKLRGSNPELFYGGDDQIVTFAGTRWNSLQLKFYKGKLVEIVFQIEDMFHSSNIKNEDEMSVGSTLVANSLYRKYSKYKRKEDLGDLTRCDRYSDGRTGIMLLYRERSDYKKPFLAFGYYDEKLSAARMREELKFIDDDL